MNTCMNYVLLLNTAGDRIGALDSPNSKLVFIRADSSRHPYGILLILLSPSLSCSL
jgi:hypothetical protein